MDDTAPAMVSTLLLEPATVEGGQSFKDYSRSCCASTEGTRKACLSTTLLDGVADCGMHILAAAPSSTYSLLLLYHHTQLP